MLSKKAGESPGKVCQNMDAVHLYEGEYEQVIAQLETIPSSRWAFEEQQSRSNYELILLYRATSHKGLAIALRHRCLRSHENNSGDWVSEQSDYDLAIGQDTILPALPSPPPAGYSQEFFRQRFFQRLAPLVQRLHSDLVEPVLEERLRQHREQEEQSQKEEQRRKRELLEGLWLVQGSHCLAMFPDIPLQGSTP